MVGLALPASTTSCSGVSASIVAPTSITARQTLSLSAVVNPGSTSATYTWTGPAGFTSTASAPTIPNTTTANSGNYQLIVSLPGGCTTTASTNVTVIVSPVVSATDCNIRIVAKDATGTETDLIPRSTTATTGASSLTLSVEHLDGLALTGYTYQWSRQSGTSAALPVGSTPVISATARSGVPVGEYKVVMTSPEGSTCTAFITLRSKPCRQVAHTYNCGTTPATPVGNVNDPLLTNLAPGDTIRTGDFDVVVMTVSGGSGGWTGTGYTEIPYLKNTRIAVELKGAVVNDCYELVGGTVVSAYDPNWGGLQDVTQAVNVLKELSARVVDLLDTYTGTPEQKTALQAASEALCDKTATTASTLPDKQSQALTGQCQNFRNKLDTFLACPAPAGTSSTSGNNGGRVAAGVATTCDISKEESYDEAVDLQNELDNVETKAYASGIADEKPKANAGTATLLQVMDVCQQAVRWLIKPAPTLISNTVTVDGKTYIPLCLCTKTTGDCGANGFSAFVEKSAYEAAKAQAGSNIIKISQIKESDKLQANGKYVAWTNATEAKAFLQNLATLNIPDLNQQKVDTIADLIGQMRGEGFDIYKALTTPTNTTFTGYLYEKMATTNLSLSDLEQALKTYRVHFNMS